MLSATVGSAAEIVDVAAGLRETCRTSRSVEFWGSARIHSVRPGTMEKYDSEEDMKRLVWERRKTREADRPVRGLFTAPASRERESFSRHPRRALLGFLQEAQIEGGVGAVRKR